MWERQYVNDRNTLETKDREKINLDGERFGRLLVIGESEPYINPSGRKIYMWKCVCDCGKECVVSTSDLRNGHTVSCGCYHKERISATNTIHGKSNERLYNIYRDMHIRCENPNFSCYKWYGGKGIVVCDEWSGNDGIENFVRWALGNGYQDHLTIDRIDGNKGYEPDNCRWVTRKQQSNNIRSNRILIYNGKRYTLSELSEATGINYSTLNNRINTRKLSVKEAVETPIDYSKKRR